VYKKKINFHIKEFSHKGTRWL